MEPLIITGISTPPIILYKLAACDVRGGQYSATRPAARRLRGATR